MAATTLFSTGNPDGKMATASRPDSPSGIEIESADDFTLSGGTSITGATDHSIDRKPHGGGAESFLSRVQNTVLCASDSRHQERKFVMRDDLLPAQSCVDWAVAQMEVLQSRLIAWRQDTPYRLADDLDPETGEKLVRLRDIKLPPAIINVEAGLIINAIRS